MAELNNERHEKFVRGLAQRNAYRAAFPNSVKWKDSTVDSKACNLAKEDKILARLKELQAAATSNAVMSAIKRKEWLTELITSETEETKDKLKAIDILNKMEGEYTEKLQMSGSVNNPFEGLTTDELKKLIESE